MSAKLDVSFEMDGNPAGTPRNAAELQIIHQWNTAGNSGDNSESEIGQTKFEFVLSDAEYLIDWKNKGLTGGPGIYESVPYNINLYDGVTKTTLPFCINLAKRAKFKSDCEVVAEIEKSASLNWLDRVANSFDYDYLASLNAGTNGKISESDYVKIPYVLNYRPEAFALTMISMSLYMMTKELIQATKDLTDAIAELSAAIANTPFSIGLFIQVAIKTVARIAYTIAIVVAIINLANQILDQLFPPVRRYYGIRVKTLFEKSCEYLGLNFKSTIFDGTFGDKWQKLTYLPTKDKRGGLFGQANGTGHPNAFSSIRTFKDLINIFKDFFNADIRIQGNDFYFERVDFWDNQASYVLPDVETNQDERLSEYEENTEELSSNEFFTFTTDIQDQNTLETFKGTNYKVFTQPIVVKEQKNVNLEGLSEVRMPFALADRKDELTEVETALRGMLAFIDGLVNFFGGNSNLANQIDTRIGMMSLSADTISVEKLLIIDNEEIPSAYSDQLHAIDMWGFHCLNSFVPTPDPYNGNKLVHNQHHVYTGVKVNFCYQDYLALLNSNKFYDKYGRIGTMLLLKWNVFLGTAEIDYKIKELHSKNLTLVFSEGE